MPIFEYACSECGHRFEVLVKPSTVPACPSCKSKKLEKQLSAFAVQAGGASHDVPQGCQGCHQAQPGGGCMMGHQH